MNMTKFKVGDVVQLKSGGPKMTVSSVPRGPNPDIPLDMGTKNYNCRWFKGGSLEHGQFEEELLTSVETEGSKQTKGK